MPFSFYKQLNAMDCGPTCLRMVAQYYGRHFNTQTIKNISGYGKEGVNLLGIAAAAEHIGFRARGVQLTYKQLTQEALLPAILHWQQNHFVVLLPFSKWGRGIRLADPAKGIITITVDEFKKHWLSTTNELGEQVGTALLLEPTAAFFEQKGEKNNKLNFNTVTQYLTNSKWQITQVIIALILGSLLQLVLPFLTQSIVDTGITTQNISFITIVLIAQLVLVASQTFIDFVRSRLLLGISIVLNFSLLSDFWLKLTKLPISYFDSYHTGDTLQRINDTKRIENFLTGSALNTFFSLFSFIIFSVVLVSYNVQLFFVFAAGSILYFLWIRLFLRIRRKLNYETFHLSAKENNATLQLVQGMQEIKLHGAEQIKRWEWESLQAGIFKLNFKNLNYSQLQQSGALLINQGKNLTITFLVANLVVQGKLTLGAMLAVQYIIGQLNSPIEQFIGFMQTAQDAKISLERINEIHQLNNEEAIKEDELQYIQALPQDKSISLQNFSFTYSGAGNEPVLKNINIAIPEGKITAIVGASGSGKTTLLKLLLKFYDSYEGDIKIGNTNLKYISPSFFRKQCGAVMQDGYIFNDSIAKNIAVGFDNIEYNKLIEACRIANILPFIESLPNGFNTKLGTDGVGISQGQKQRLLIARAVYKNPIYLFLDEATNALDANNEKAIVKNLQVFFEGKTVVVVAHRLSTVKNADNIIVLENGVIVEQGTHKTLAQLQGKYYELVKNQLELGN
ncbi:MAG: peptidase domain-containing ABC transporter [Bacteroidetes bacterium]|nr:peptidase domain-containing ABC transporter [Bacteroidota bacterium]MBS1591042.1 peptidase domain-containing ABC transporter [Bacteroidota bacterium]